MKLGQNIKKYRKELGLTQTDLAKRVDAIQTDVHRWEAGKVTPSIESLKKLAKSLGISIDSLLFTEKERKHLKIADKEFMEKLRDIDRLTPEDRITIANMIDALKAKSNKT